MGNSVVKEKLCLIPPQIKQRHREYLDKTDLDILGRATRELASDFFPADDIEVNLFLKPTIPSPNAPDVNTHSRLSAAIFEDPAKVSGMLAVDAEVPSTGVHLHAFGGATASGTPTGSVAIEQRLNRAKWWIEGQPLRDGGRVGAGFAVTHPNVAIGASYSENLSSNAQPQQGTGSKDMNVWGTVKIPGLMLGTRIAADENTQSLEQTKADFALSIYDPTSKHRDRPNFEISMLAQNWGQQLSLSYFQHFVVRRKIFNPLEENHITHIVNYLDLGTRIGYDQISNTPHIGLAGSWQLNKNQMVKAKVDSQNAAICYVFKNWFLPSFALSTGCKYNYKRQKTTFGLSFSLETIIGAGDFEQAPEGYEAQLIKSQAEVAPPVERYTRIDKPVLNK